MITFPNPTPQGSLYQHEGLRDFLKTRHVTPTVIDRETLRELDTTQVAAYNAKRISHLSGGILIDTPNLTEARKVMEKLFLLNSGRDNIGNHGLIITGDGGLGKTTTSLALMKWVYSQYERQFPDLEQRGHIPVAYIEVPAGCTAKRLVIAFADFFGLTVSLRDTLDSIQHRVISAINRANTRLVVIDELHNLTARNVGILESVDQLKIFSNRINSTFLYAGVGLTDETLSGARGQQVAGRFTMMNMPRYNLSNPAHVAAWAGIITAFEKQLTLAEQTPGSLVKLAPLLFERSQGSINTLKSVITGAAMDLICDPAGRPEAITKELILAQRVDMAAQSAFERSLTGRKGKAA